MGRGVKLVVEGCVDCGACVDICPYAVSTKILNCNHCNVCVETCPKNAFYEVMPGIYGVDKNICDGCGECFCPYDALEIKGYARKCDLCGGEPRCVNVCIKGLHLEQTEDEKELSKGVLGWEKTDGEYESGLKELTTGQLKIIQEIKLIFKELLKEEEVELDEVIDDYLREKDSKKDESLEIVKQEIEGFSALDRLLKDDELEEIVVNGKRNVKVYHRDDGWLTADFRFTNNEKLIELINKMARQVGRRVTLQNPRVNAILPDGSRLHALIPPLVKEPTITIRKFQRNFFTPKKLIETKTITSEALAFLWLVVESDLNLLICGPTGSGKTTTLNALTSFIPNEDRVIAVEEIPEISVNSKHFVRLVANEKLGITMDKLVTETLRMRPDKLIVGEIRDSEEVKAFINSAMAGQGRGSITTFHALSDVEVLSRLKHLGVSELELNSIDVILVQKRWKVGRKELRRVFSMSEVVDSDPITLFRYDFRKDQLVKIKDLPASNRLLESLRLSKKEFERELEKRRSFLETWCGEGDLNEAYRQYL